MTIIWLLVGCVPDEETGELINPGETYRSELFEYNCTMTEEHRILLQITSTTEYSLFKTATKNNINAFRMHRGWQVRDRDWGIKGNQGWGHVLLQPG